MQPEGFDDALGASYRLLDRLGEGATGEVWRAVDKRTDQTVATKLLRREHLADRDLVGRFVQERSVLTGLRHPSIVEVRDLVVEGERLAIVMEYVDGGSLRDVLASQGTLAPGLAVEVAATVLDALASAHQRGVVHRDVKPDNVLLQRSWESLAPGTVKLVDFGIARILTDRQRSTTGLLGTPEYMSPELLTRGTAEAPADVYGVGILLYELLAGRTPFAGPGNEYTIAHRHVTADPPPLDVPARLAAQLASLLGKDPTLRPTASAAAAALRALAGELAGLPRLAAQESPTDFESARGPATVVRGLQPLAPAGPSGSGDLAGAEPLDGEDGAAPVDLGSPGQQTTVRPMQRRRVEDETAPTIPARRATVPGWKDPKLIAVVAGALVVLAGAVLFVVLRGGGADEPGPADPTASTAAGGPAQATVNEDQPSPAGLDLTRTATWDPETQQVSLTLDYSAERAPLSGEVLEVLQDPDGLCPTDMTWDGPQPEANQVSTTSIDVACGWSLDIGTIQPRQSATFDVTFTLPLEIEDGGDADSALAQWLDGVKATTSMALQDPQVNPSVSSYPVQRLVGVTVQTDTSTVIGRVLPVSIYPVWPPGGDQTTPIFVTGAVGDPSSVVAAIAGGNDGIKLSTSCPSEVTISNQVVSANSPTDACTINAEVGNLEQVMSGAFAVITRGS